MESVLNPFEYFFRRLLFGSPRVISHCPYRSQKQNCLNCEKPRIKRNLRPIKPEKLLKNYQCRYAPDAQEHPHLLYRRLTVSYNVWENILSAHRLNSSIRSASNDSWCIPSWRYLSPTQLDRDRDAPPSPPTTTPAIPAGAAALRMPQRCVHTFAGVGVASRSFIKLSYDHLKKVPRNLLLFEEEEEEVLAADRRRNTVSDVKEVAVGCACCSEDPSPRLLEDETAGGEMGAAEAAPSICSVIAAFVFRSSKSSFASTWTLFASAPSPSPSTSSIDALGLFSPTESLVDSAPCPPASWAVCSALLASSLSSLTATTALRFMFPKEGISPLWMMELFPRLPRPLCISILLLFTFVCSRLCFLLFDAKLALEFRYHSPKA